MLFFQDNEDKELRSNAHDFTYLLSFSLLL
jgi:hypothetical protein